MANENAMYSNGHGNGMTGQAGRHGGMTDVEKGNTGIGAAMSPQEEDRFERFAAAMAANNKLRDAQRVNSLRYTSRGQCPAASCPAPPILLTTMWVQSG